MALASDEFNLDSLGSHWTFVDPVGGCSVLVANSRASIVVPGGIDHHTDQTTANAPYIYQTADADFDVQVKFDSSVYGNSTRHFQEHGLIVYNSDQTEWMGAYIYSSTADSRLFFFKKIAGVGTSIFNAKMTFATITAGGCPSHLRLVKSGSVWTVYVSGDGINWNQESTHTQAFVPSRLGILAGNLVGGSASAVAFTARIDRFDVGTPAPPSTTVSTTNTTSVTDDFTGDLGATPDIGKWVVNANGLTGAATLEGNELRLRHGQEDGSRGALYSIANGSNIGAVLKYKFPVDANIAPSWFVVGFSANQTAVESGGGAGEAEGFADPYSPNWGYIVELGQKNNLARPFKVDDGDTDGNYEFNTYAQMGEVAALSSAGSYRWIRVERLQDLVNTRGIFRFRSWLDGNTEPTTWDFEGWDGVHEGPGRLYLSYANNDAAGTGPLTRDLFIDNLEIYTIAAAVTGGTMDSVGRLNELAGTVGLEEAGALNALNGSSGIEIVGCLNSLAGTIGLEKNGAANAWAGTTALGYNGALKNVTIV